MRILKRLIRLLTHLYLQFCLKDIHIVRYHQVMTSIGTLKNS